MERQDAVLTLYGIANCDTVKRARAWLAARGVEVVFHDYKKQGVPEALKGWIAAHGTQALINKKGSTWRKLSAAQMAEAADSAGAATLMQREPSCIKRPVLARGPASLVGFDEAAWKAFLA